MWEVAESEHVADTWTFYPAVPGNTLSNQPLSTSPMASVTSSTDAVQTKVSSRAAINNSSAIMAMAVAHADIGLVPDFSAQDALERGLVQVVLPDWALGDSYTGTVYAAYMPGLHLPLKTRSLIDYLVETREVIHCSQ